MSRIIIFSLFIFIISVKSDDIICGRSFIIDRIINTKSNNHQVYDESVISKFPGAWPWMASIGNYHSDSLFYSYCGGSLITEQFVLSAAHCFDPSISYNFNIQEWRVRLGVLDLDSSKVHESNIRSIFKHPGYDTTYYDVALIRLKSPVIFSDYIRPICLPICNLASPIINFNYSRSATLVGWGKTSDGNNPRTMKSVALSIIPRKSCDKAYNQTGSGGYGYHQGITSELICSGYEYGGLSSCDGDSGSPLVIFDFNKEQHVIVGIINKGVGCGNAILPGTSARVQHPKIINWILKIIGGKKSLIQFQKLTSTNVPKSCPNTEISTNDFEYAAGIPVRGSQNHQVGNEESSIVLISGMSDWDVTNRVDYLYRDGSCSSSNIPPFPSKIFYHGAVFVKNSIIVCGGTNQVWTGQTACGIWKLGESQDTTKWRYIKDMPEPKVASAQIVYKDEIYIIGGYWIPEIVKYNFNSDSWTKIDDWNVHSSYGCAVQYGNGFIFMGGETYPDETPNSQVLYYDLKSQKIVQFPNMTLTRSRFGCQIVTLDEYGEGVMVVGGKYGPTFADVTTNVEFLALNLNQLKWETLPPMNYPRLGFPVFGQLNNKIMVAGGNGRWVLDNVESFDQENWTWNIEPFMLAGGSRQRAASVVIPKKLIQC